MFSAFYSHLKFCSVLELYNMLVFYSVANYCRLRDFLGHGNIFMYGFLSTLLYC